jgi:hypothetical protein
MPENRRRLRSYLLNPQYQLKFIFWLTIPGVCLIAVNALVFYYYVRENYAILVDLSPMTDAAKTQLYAELGSIIFKLVAFAVVFLFIVMFLGLILSHRTVGPLYRMKKICQAICVDDMAGAAIQLRPGDDFRDVADSFREAVAHLSKK